MGGAVNEAVPGPPAANRFQSRRPDKMQTIQHVLSSWADKFGEWAVGLAATGLAVVLILAIWYLAVSRPERSSAAEIEAREGKNP
jgi:hypothetical protein